MASAVYEVLLSADHFVNRFRSRDDRSPYVLTAAVKHRVKRLIRFVSNYENAIRRHAEQADCEGVICGHIHTPQLVERDGFLYGNSGDWVEHCTALVEHNDGSLVLKSFYGDRVLAKVFGNDGLSVTAAAQRTSVRTIQSNPIWLERDNDLVGVLTDTDC